MPTKKVIKKTRKKLIKKKPTSAKASAFGRRSCLRPTKSAGKAKKAVSIKKTMAKPQENEKPAGKVIHYFDKIGVAVLSFDEPIAVGDTIRIAGGEGTDFEQEVASMEVDHQKVQKAKKGDEVGLKVKEKVHEGYKVYKV